MVIIIHKNSSLKEIKQALKKLHKSKNKPGLSSFYGKLKDVFGDGLDYQKKIRTEWD